MLQFLKKKNDILRGVQGNLGSSFSGLKVDILIKNGVKKRGRPPKEDAKRRIISVRVKGTDIEKLEYLVKEKGMTYTDVFEEGLKMTYNLKKFT